MGFSEMRKSTLLGLGVLKERTLSYPEEATKPTFEGLL